MNIYIYVCMYEINRLSLHYPLSTPHPHPYIIFIILTIWQFHIILLICSLLFFKKKYTNRIQQKMNIWMSCWVFWKNVCFFLRKKWLFQMSHFFLCWKKQNKKKTTIDRAKWKFCHLISTRFWFNCTVMFNCITVLEFV